MSININCGEFELDKHTEKTGYLLKRSDQQNNKWQNRFCILKDNFFLWYKEDDAIKMKKSKYFNIKPQGVIYLNDCIIREIVDSNQCCCFIIENAAFQKPLVFSVDNQLSRESWIENLIFNSSINYHNMLETQRFVKDLMQTTSTMKYAKVKQQFYDAKDENEMLIKLKEQLQKENEEKEQSIKELQLEFSKFKEDMDEAYRVMNNLETSKSHLEKKNSKLENDLKNLELQRLKTAQLMNTTSSKEHEIESLQTKLDEISQLREKIDQDRENIKRKLIEKEGISLYLEQENQRIVNQAQELNNLINKLKNQNTDVQRKLELEKAARIQAEERLRDAEQSLGRLHCNIVEGGTKYTNEKKTEMASDVNKLKDYFENMIDSHGPSPRSPNGSETPVTRARTTSKTRIQNTISNLNKSANSNDTDKSEIGLWNNQSKLPLPSQQPYRAADTIRVREESQKLREEHRKAISQIQWADSDE